MYTKRLSSLALVLIPGACHGLIETCADLLAAFELTQTQDVVVEIHPFTDVECDTFTNMTMTSNTLTVKWSENRTNVGSSTSLVNIRLDVTNGAKLFWETNVDFAGDEEVEHTVDGGAVYVGEGSTVRFLREVEMRNVGIISERDEGSDHASFVRSGGCVWTAGYFRVDGEATFTGCENVGGGESFPGPGGAVYVGETGSALFNEGVTITETYITDDFGGKGGGIYNLGKVNIKGDSHFEEISASSGVAIYNGEGATFNFRNGAKAFFRVLNNIDSTGSALVNLGYFKFSGPALFFDAELPVILAANNSETIISEDSAFWTFDESPGDALFVSDGAEFTLPDSVTFVGFD